MRRVPSSLLPALLLATALASAGCSKETKPAAPAAPNPQGDALSAPVAEFPCVRFEDLARHLPRSLEGYKAEGVEGSSGRYGEVSISEAERVYTGADGEEISIRIVDTTMAEELGRAIRAAASDAAHRDKGDPTAPIIHHDTVGFVRYDRLNQRAEANLLVANRFVVAVTSRNVEGTDEVRRVANQMDLNALALLR